MNKVDVALDSLVAIIIKIGPGGLLPNQSDLAVQLGVGRSALREALSKLVFLDMITMRTRTGTIVKPISEWKTRNDEVVEWQARAGATPS